jgi:hypothetical protein
MNESTPHTYRVYGPSAVPGDFIKDKSHQKRSMGYVIEVDAHTNMMKVKFPKIGKVAWVVWENHGHYIVI